MQVPRTGLEHVFPAGHGGIREPHAISGAADGVVGFGASFALDVVDEDGSLARGALLVARGALLVARGALLVAVESVPAVALAPLDVVWLFTSSGPTEAGFGSVQATSTNTTEPVSQLKPTTFDIVGVDDTVRHASRDLKETTFGSPRGSRTVLGRVHAQFFDSGFGRLSAVVQRGLRGRHGIGRFCA